MRHQGGGHKQMLRLIDFKREKYGIPGRVATIEYDPNRSARIALIHYLDGEKRYILQPVGLKVGATISSGPTPIFWSETLCHSRIFLRHDGSRDRIEAGQGRADGAFGRDTGSVGGQGGRVRPAQAALGRDPQGTG